VKKMAFYGTRVLTTFTRASHWTCIKRRKI